jgi:pyridoxal/pyridoxine/pyridoxamine kinase
MTMAINLFYQLLIKGFDVDFINSVQFSNHTGKINICVDKLAAKYSF